MKITGRDGVLRIYDSTPILHGAGVFAAYTIHIITQILGGTWLDLTAAVNADDSSYGNNFLGTTADLLCVGSTQKFSKVRYLKGDAANYAAGSGALIGKYWNGSTLATLENVVDGTASSGNCFGQDGYISFKIPADWAIGANAYNANLNSDKYYVFFQETTSSTVDPDADILCPCEDQYFEVVFANMDFSGPLGRSLVEEILVLNRAKMDANAHYIEGSDDKLFEPMPISFSALLDDTVNRLALRLALICDNPSSTYWTATGTSTKGNSQNDGTNANPTFVDTAKKTVNVHILWDTGRTGGHDEGVAYYECYFDPSTITFKEDENGVTVTCNGLCYGVIQHIHGFGNRY